MTFNNHLFSYHIFPCIVTTSALFIRVFLHVYGKQRHVPIYSKFPDTGREKHGFSEYDAACPAAIIHHPASFNAHQYQKAVSPCAYVGVMYGDSINIEIFGSEDGIGAIILVISNLRTKLTFIL